MAQIVVFGRVMHELVPKEGQSKQQYVCFDLMERSGNTPPDYYQVWARGDDVTTISMVQKFKPECCCIMMTALLSASWRAPTATEILRLTLRRLPRKFIR